MESNSNNNQQKVTLKENLRATAEGIWAFLRSILNLREGADIENTMKGIIKDVDFKGYNIYILVCSIFIASIGLNVNSTAVIIGAMLISPLMGPILGVGLAVGINDFALLKKSLKSLGVATAAALITSTIYFLITPLKEEQPELLARTSPTLLDALIAIFGGFAGIIAGSRKEKSNVVPGVAIATALMPPLCTAGYGLASGQWSYFFGAFYLYLINSIFISIATFVIVKYLQFPIKEFVDPIREKLVKKYIYTFVVIVLIPSGIIFWGVLQKSYFRAKVEAFMVDNFKLKETQVMSYKANFTDSISTIEIFLIGEPLSDDTQDLLAAKLQVYDLDDTKLILRQNTNNTTEMAGQLSKEIRTGIIEDIYKKNAEQLQEKELRIKELEQKLARLERDPNFFASLKREIEIQYTELKSFSFGVTYQTYRNSTKTDTIPTVLVKWNQVISTETKIYNQTKLSSWLEVRLGEDSVRVVSY